LAALIGCAACCTLPMLGLLGLGGGVAASAAGLLGARWELVLGAGASGLALSLMLVRARMRARAAAGGDTCAVQRSPASPRA
jgi:membrane protein implicated in regulation of membrane protease activity